MLSIGKLSAGQAKYYLGEAGGRVDAVESIGEGLEEYYVGGREARGEWIGSAGAELGLTGRVAGEELRAVLAGVDPRDGSALRSSASPVRVGGFDLTFSAPKSVSVLFGVGDVELRGAVRAAHDVAVRQAVAYLEVSSAAVRRGRGGLVVEEASGLVAAGFRHRTSRAGDPQLHTHVLVANLGRGVDGRWSALDGRRLYARARAASFVYQAVLRGEMTRRLGVEWSPVRKGIGEIVGVRRQVIAEFSRRRAEIEAALEERDATGARAAEAPALATRRPKDRATTAELVEAGWRERAARLGLGRRELGLIVGRARSTAPTREDWARAADELARPEGLTRAAATFTRDEVLQGFCERLPAGSQVDAAVLQAAADRFLASERAVALIPDDSGRERGVGFRRRDGRVVPVDRHAVRYSTPAQLALEQRLVNRVLDVREQGAGTADPADVDRATVARPSLSDEQRAVVERLCLGGDGVAVLAGKAGTGKTFALGAAREAWQAAGHPVLGVATARRAAVGLQEGAGIKSTTTFALLHDLRDRGGRLPDSCVLVVDEAGMVSTRVIAELTDRVLAVGGKLVLVGDHRQLPELEAGGTFRSLVRRGLAMELRENVRQRHGWERRALDLLRDGEPEPALAAYARPDRLTVEPTEARTRERLVADWWASGDLDGAVMIAARRVEAADLNERAHARMREAGALGDGVETAAGNFAIGDVVVVRRNDSRRGVTNGDRGRVVGVDPEQGAIVIERRGERIRLDRVFLAEPTRTGDPPIEHGYAITAHIAQGVTVDHAFVLAGEGIDREWAYVAMSRGRESNHLYLADATDDARAEYAPVTPSAESVVARLARQLRSSSAQLLAIDTGRAPSTHQAEAAARAERRRLEQRGHQWLPGRRRELEVARQRERDARRERLEAEHAGRSADEKLMQTFARHEEARHRDQASERVIGREHRISRERGFGRER